MFNATLNALHARETTLDGQKSSTLEPRGSQNSSSRRWCPCPTLSAVRALGKGSRRHPSDKVSRSDPASLFREGPKTSLVGRSRPPTPPTPRRPISPPGGCPTRLGSSSVSLVRRSHLPPGLALAWFQRARPDLRQDFGSSVIWDPKPQRSMRASIRRGERRWVRSMPLPAPPATISRGAFEAE